MSHFFIDRPVFAAVIALSLGGGTGVGGGFAAGLVYDLSTTGPIGLMALMLSIASYILGMEVHDRISEEPVMTLIPFSIAALSVSLVYGLLALAFGMGESLFDAIFLRALPSALLTISALSFSPSRSRIERKDCSALSATLCTALQTRSSSASSFRIEKIS